MDQAAQLALSLFGSFAVSLITVDGTSRPVPLSDRPGSLLAYLALKRGQLFSRIELTATLWPDRGETVGSGTFNTTLWRLRRAIEQPPLVHGALIASDGRGWVGLRAGESLRLDLDEYEQLLVPTLAKPAPAMNEADLLALRRGVELYRGDILVGFSDEWALREREKHRRHQLNALGRLMQLSAFAGDANGGIRYAQAILDLDMLREDVHRELMRFYVLAGQRALALRQFEVCRAALRTELAIQPMRETLALYQRIANSAVGHDDEPPAAERVELRPAPPPAPPTAAELIAAARRHLAAADAQLKMSLPLFEPPPG